MRILKHNFSLLNTDHVQLDNKWNYKNIISPYHRIYYIDEGNGQISDIDKMLGLEPGYLYIIPSFTLCNMICFDYLSQYFVQFFEESPNGISIFANSRSIAKVNASEIDKKNFQRLVSINPGRGINRSDNPKVYEKNIYYKEYQELNNHQNTTNFLETQGILLQLISRFSVQDIFKHKQKEERFIPAKILDAINFISLNLNLPITIRMLADRANQNVDYFSRLFEEHTGVRPSVFITERKIERAQYLIAVSQEKYSRIAEATGFDSLSHFSKTFKKITGLSPREYKRQIYFDA